MTWYNENYYDLNYNEKKPEALKEAVVNLINQINSKGKSVSLISPIAIVLFVYLVNMNMNIFSTAEPILSFYLFWSGFMTLVPLFLYTLGFKIIGIGPASMILFLTPTSQFLLGITYFGEILTLEKFLGFLIIWVAVSIYLNELRKE